MNLLRLSILPVIVLFPYSYALTTDPKPQIMFDFEGSHVIVYGVFQSENTKTGLESEVGARKNGVQVLADYLARPCTGSPSWDPKKITSISKLLKSQGSEIYAKGTLRIVLSAPFKNIFDDSSEPATIKGGPYQNIGFKLPMMPGESVNCGKVTIDTGLQNPFQGHFIAVNKAFDHIVQLTLTDKKILKAFSPEDQELMKKISWTNAALPTQRTEK